jgi:hypothetical protein
MLDIDGWWRTNRHASPDLFADELLLLVASVARRAAIPAICVSRMSTGRPASPELAPRGAASETVLTGPRAPERLRRLVAGMLRDPTR